MTTVWKASGHNEAPVSRAGQGSPAATEARLSAAADAYRELRRAQHVARLDEQPTQFDPGHLAGPRDDVLALWRTVFG